MKAIIMAGGEGTRLRPLTCAIPKPMVPLLGRPVMEYTQELLRAHGFEEVTATLMYRPEVIQQHFGDSMGYFVEEEPLGTAGGVKRAAGDMKDTLLVMSGDALTDVDLSAALAFHRQSGAVATMVLMRSENPTEFGVVVTGRDGRVERFLEKPSAGEVLSDTINAGIYFLEPAALAAIPQGKFDFGQNLFPQLVEAGKPVYGYVAGGYWCDIGDISTYLKAHRDALDGRIRLIEPCPGGVYIHKMARVENGVQLSAPCWIGEGAVVRSGARVGAYSVLGKGSSLGAGASVARSVLWEGAALHEGAEARGALLMQGASLMRGAQAYEGAVVGEGTCVGERAVLSPGALVWPHKQIEGGMRVSGHLVWGGASAELMRGRGARGGVGQLSPEVCALLGAALARSAGAACAVGEGLQGAARMAADAFSAGVMSAGGRVYRLGVCAPQSVQYAIRSFELSGGCAVRLEGGMLALDFFGAEGIELSASQMRALRQNFLKRDAALAPPESIPAPVEVRGARHQRCREMRQVAGVTEHTGMHLCVEAEDPTILREAREMLSEVVALTESGEGVIRARVAPGGEAYQLFDEEGAEVAGHHLTPLFAQAIHAIDPEAPFYAAADTTADFESFAGSLGARVLRGEGGRRAMQELLSGEEAAQELWRAVYFDALGALLILCGYLGRRKQRLCDALRAIKAPHIRQLSFAVREGEKARAMRELIESTRYLDATLGQGVRLKTRGGWALLYPSDEAPEFRVVCEGYSSEAADELAGFCIDLLRGRKP